MNKLERAKGWKRNYLLNGNPLEEGFYGVEGENKTPFKAKIEIITYEQKLPGHSNKVKVDDIKMTTDLKGMNFSRILDREDIDNLKFEKIKED